MSETVAYHRRVAVGLVLTAALLVGCADDEQGSSEAVHRIEIEHVGSLIDDEGPGGSYGGQANLTLLDDGRLLFWDHYQPTRIRVYDSDLDLDTVFGRAGTGPGEFERPRFHGVVEDTLFVYQEWVGRLDLFDKDDYSHLETRLGRLGNPMALAFSPDGYMVASSMDISPEGIGLPLREAGTSGEVRAAFGAEFPVLIGRDLPLHARQLDFANDGSLWVVPMFEARLERWRRGVGPSPEWSLDTAFAIPGVEMASPMDFVATSRSTETPPSPRFLGVSQEPDGPVWVMLSVPHRDWRDRLYTVEKSQSLRVAPTTTQLVTRLFALDPRVGDVLASRTLQEQWVQFAGEGVAVSWDMDPLGIPYIELWRPRLVREPPPS